MNDTIHMSATDERLVPGTLVISCAEVTYVVVAVTDHRLILVRVPFGDAEIDIMTFDRKYFLDMPIFSNARLVVVPT